jgi:hypothetical protein
MKDVFAVLRQRELDLLRVREEVEALRCVIPLLTEEATPVRATTNVSAASLRADNKWPLEIRASTP